MTNEEFDCCYRERADYTLARLRKQIGQDAEDVAQYLWSSFFRRRASLDFARFDRYLNRAIGNAIKDEYKRRRHRPRLQVIDVECEQPPESRAMRNEVRELLNQYIAALPPSDQRVFQVYQQSKSQLAAAKKLGVDKSVVKRVLFGAARYIHKAA